MADFAHAASFPEEEEEVVEEIPGFLGSDREMRKFVQNPEKGIVEQTLLKKPCHDNIPSSWDKLDSLWVVKECCVAHNLSKFASRFHFYLCPLTSSSPSSPSSPSPSFSSSFLSHIFQTGKILVIFCEVHLLGDGKGRMVGKMKDLLLPLGFQQTKLLQEEEEGVREILELFPWVREYNSQNKGDQKYQRDSLKKLKESLAAAVPVFKLTAQTFEDLCKQKMKEEENRENFFQIMKGPSNFNHRFPYFPSSSPSSPQRKRARVGKHR